MALSETRSWESLPVMLTISETAALTRTSPATVYAACRSGWLRGVATKAGSQWRIPRDRLRALLEGERT